MFDFTSIGITEAEKRIHRLIKLLEAEYPHRAYRDIFIMYLLRWLIFQFTQQ